MPRALCGGPCPTAGVQLDPVTLGVRFRHMHCRDRHRVMQELEKEVSSVTERCDCLPTATGLDKHVDNQVDALGPTDLAWRWMGAHPNPWIFHLHRGCTTC